jgi:D-arabinose 1-dehydrogenase-like Zn-dependent alcohol dehydrogenase
MASSCHAKPEDYDEMRCAEMMWSRASTKVCRSCFVLKGGGRGPTKLGVVPLSDGAGEVAAAADRVTRVKLGDRVSGTFRPRWTRP